MALIPGKLGFAMYKDNSFHITAISEILAKCL
jgi:hypothetical protein